MFDSRAVDYADIWHSIEIKFRRTAALSDTICYWACILDIRAIDNIAVRL
jgi:hypothetical protein